MPMKVRQLIQALRAAGFSERGGKGSHRNFTHVSGVKVTVSGKPGSDAKPYQERAVTKAIGDAKR